MEPVQVLEYCGRSWERNYTFDLVADHSITLYSKQSLGEVYIYLEVEVVLFCPWVSLSVIFPEEYFCLPSACLFVVCVLECRLMAAVQEETLFNFIITSI